MLEPKRLNRLSSNFAYIILGVNFDDEQNWSSGGHVDKWVGYCASKFYDTHLTT